MSKYRNFFIKMIFGGFNLITLTSHEITAAQAPFNEPFMDLITKINTQWGSDGKEKICGKGGILQQNYQVCYKYPEFIRGFCANQKVKGTLFSSAFDKSDCGQKAVDGAKNKSKGKVDKTQEEKSRKALEVLFKNYGVDTSPKPTSGRPSILPRALNPQASTAPEEPTLTPETAVTEQPVLTPRPTRERLVIGANRTRAPRSQSGAESMQPGMMEQMPQNERQEVQRKNLMQEIKGKISFPSETVDQGGSAEDLAPFSPGIDDMIQSREISIENYNALLTEMHRLAEEYGNASELPIKSAYADKTVKVANYISSGPWNELLKNMKIGSPQVKMAESSAQEMKKAIWDKVKALGFVENKSGRLYPPKPERQMEDMTALGTMKPEEAVAIGGTLNPRTLEDIDQLKTDKEGVEDLKNFMDLSGTDYASLKLKMGSISGIFNKSIPQGTRSIISNWCDQLMKSLDKVIAELRDKNGVVPDPARSYLNLTNQLKMLKDIKGLTPLLANINKAYQELEIQQGAPEATDHSMIPEVKPQEEINQPPLANDEALLAMKSRAKKPRKGRTPPQKGTGEVISEAPNQAVKTESPTSSDLNPQTQKDIEQLVKDQEVVENMNQLVTSYGPTYESSKAKLADINSMFKRRIDQGFKLTMKGIITDLKGNIENLIAVLKDHKKTLSESARSYLNLSDQIKSLKDIRDLWNLFNDANKAFEAMQHGDEGTSAENEAPLTDVAGESIDKAEQTSPILLGTVRRESRSTTRLNRVDSVRPTKPFVDLPDAGDIQEPEVVEQQKGGVQSAPVANNLLGKMDTLKRRSQEISSAKIRNSLEQEIAKIANDVLPYLNDMAGDREIDKGLKKQAEEEIKWLEQNGYTKGADGKYIPPQS